MSAQFGHAVAHQRRRQHAGRLRRLGGEQRQGHQRQPADESIPQAGAVYVFTRRGAAWTQQAYIKASNTGEAGTADTFGDGDQFGFSLALSRRRQHARRQRADRRQRRQGINGNQADNTRGVGRRRLRLHAHGSQLGAAGVPSSRRASTPATCSATPCRSAPMAARWRSAASTRTARPRRSTGRMTTGPAAPAPSTSSPRARRAPGSQQAYIKASNAESQDSFGVHLGTQRRRQTLLVGSLDEDCAATGVNPPGVRQRLARRPVDGRRLRVRAQRDGLDAAGVPQAVEHRRQRLVRSARSP